MASRRVDMGLNMDLDQILETIVESIQTQFPEWSVSLYSPFRDHVDAPAMMVECEAGNPSEDAGAGDRRIWVDLDLSVKVTVDQLALDANAKSVAGICARLGAFVSGQTWGLEVTKPGVWRGFNSEPFVKELDHVAYWSVNWTQPCLLGQPEEIDLDEVDALYLGLAPEIGATNVGDYVEIEHE